ncbi:MAG: MFS transporter [Gemmatimonadaceae bacterium]|nr:MFS transporter [Gemmatimonadaceae bacterium]
MTVAARSRNPFRVLATHRNFRLFWVGQTLSLVGSWMQTMALGWLSLQLSNSAFVVGLVASVGAIPVVLFSMHAGALVDRADRLKVVRITQSVFLVQAVILWLLTWTGHATIGVLLVLAFVQGLATAIEVPARQSMIIQLVGRGDLQPAIALNSSGFNLARIIGPAVGGLVIHRFGIAWCFGLNAMSFVAVLWGLLLIDLPRVPSAFAGTRLRDVISAATRDARAGLRHLDQPGVVRDLLALVTVGAIFGAPFITLMPVIARDRLGLDASGYGVLLASLGVGGLIGALAIAGPATHWHRGRVTRVTGLVFPVLVILLAFTTDVRVAEWLLFAIGIVMIMFNALTNGILQLHVPEEFRGRLMAFYSLVFVGLSQAIGAFAMGAVARAIGVEWAVGASAAVTLCFALWTFARSPELARL